VDGCLSRLRAELVISFDTNLAVYATNSAMPQHFVARQFLESLARRNDVAVCEMMLVEFYLKLRNPAIFLRPLSAAEAVERCQRFRENRNWRLVESAPVMTQVLKRASEKDFEGFGFKRVWNPLAS
jgi:uncharacterized protein